MIRFGKSVRDVLSVKRSFFEQNSALLSEMERINALYAEQPPRTRCKLCDQPLAGSTSFTKHRVGYAFCTHCKHLNGLHEDTETFCRTIYSDDDGRGYAGNYSASDRQAYLERVEAIYVPKARFLADALEEQGIGNAQASCADLGAGSGYFVAALRNCNFRSVRGYEVSRTQAELAAQMNSEGAVQRHDPDELIRIIDGLDCDVVSMIGVLEHLREPRAVLAALRANTRVRFLFISVPLFSPSVFFEAVFPTVMPRHLSGAHTHLFTEPSLAWMAKEFQMTRVAEWWFGSDMMDLYRSLLVSLEGEQDTRPLADLWRSQLSPLLDDLQLQIDRRSLSSEVHALFRFERNA